MVEAMPVVIICDATEQTGLGHFLRCTVLALELQKQRCSVTFLGLFSQVALTIGRFYNLSLEPANGTVLQRVSTLPATSCIIIDSYQYNPEQLTKEHRFVLLDDFCRFSVYPVDGVINFTIGAIEYDYVARGARSQVLGLQYYLPHPDITGIQQKAEREGFSRVLIMIGSGDQHNMAPLLVSALLNLQLNLYIKVVTSQPELLHSIGNFANVELVPMVATVSDYYQWADFCITSGGLAKYECAYLGKPAAVISLTDEEAEETMQFSNAQLCFDLGHFRQQTVAGLAPRLAKILSDHVSFSSAQQACRTAFSADSAKRAAIFVINCFSGDMYDER